MPTVLRTGPYRFFIVSLDRGEPPHIHVRREDMVAKFWLEPVALQRAGGFNRAELNTIARLAQEHRETLLERWYGFPNNFIEKEFGVPATSRNWNTVAKLVGLSS